MMMIFGLGGCRKKPADDDPIDGGNTHRVDPDAPKEISSSDILDFEASFFSATRYKTDEDDRFFHFVVKEENGKLTASEKVAGVSVEAGEELLNSLQEIIVKNDLVKMNGLYDVTAGLAPEYQPGGLTVHYKSGETLTFTTDNNPYALWSEEVYDVFAKWFADHGDPSLYPSFDDLVVTRFHLEYEEDGKRYSYGGIKYSEDPTLYLRKEIERTSDWKTLYEKMIDFPEDYFEKITEIFLSTDLVRNYRFSYYDHEAGNYGNHDEGYYGMGDKTTADHEEDSETRMIDIYVECANGSRFNIETRKDSEIDAMMPVIRLFTDYLDTLFPEE